MRPLALKRADLDTREKLLDDRSALLSEEIAGNEAKQGELAEIAHRQDDERGRLADERRETERRKAGIAAEAQALLEVQKKVADLQERIGRRSVEIDGRLESESRRLAAERASVAVIREELDRERERIGKDRKRLESQRETLSLAFDLARQKNLL